MTVKYTPGKNRKIKISAGCGGKKDPTGCGSGKSMFADRKKPWGHMQLRRAE
jgi:hypothetical protein